MLKYTLRRVGLMIPTLLGLAVLLFVWVRLLPGGPERGLVPPGASQEVIDSISARYGFDQPIYVQFFTYVQALASGDFGLSIRTNQPVLSSFFDRLPATMELTVCALVLATVVGIPLGYVAGRKQGGWLDSAVVSTSLIGVVTPVFVLAIGLKYLFPLQLGLFYTQGRESRGAQNEHPTGFYLLDGIVTGNLDAFTDAAMHLVLPAVALASIPLAIIVRITRAAVSEVIHEDYVRTAQAKGLSGSVINRRHVLRNAMLPVITTVGLQLGLLLSGAVLTETVFAINGIGSYLFEAIGNRDYPVLQGYIVFIALMYALVNLAVDLSYGIIDPRVRVS